MTQSPSSAEAPADQPPPIAAVIDIGANSIRLAIAELGDNGGVRTLDHLSQAVALGSDTFTRRVIRRETIEECVRVLESYRQTLEEYGVRGPALIRVVATSAVREARNQMAFLDRIYAATGLTVEPLDEAEVSRITYNGIQSQLQGEPAFTAGRALIMEVGGGSTELLLVRRGNVVFSQTYRLGSMRLREMIEQHHAPTGKIRQIMTSQILRIVSQICEQAPIEGKIELIALGGDIRFAAKRLLPGWNPSQLGRIPLGVLEGFVNEVLELPVDRIVRRLHMSFPEAESCGPALLSYVLMARELQLEHILISDTNLRDGLLKEMAMRDPWSEEFRSQVIRSARAIGKRYDYDQTHASHVADLAATLFQQLKPIHQLPARFELHLYIAALLHEIGMYVGVRSHHKHAMYLILNSELFGVGHHDLLLIALAARYHRRATPQPLHEGYTDLDRNGRIAVAHMAALLRVAVALDDSRTRRIQEISCQIRRDDVLINVHGVQDLSLEQIALSQTKELFLEAFGREIRLRETPG